MMTGATELDNAPWRKSVRSGTDSGCVSLASHRARIAIRDSKDHHRTTIVLPVAKTRKLFDDIKAGLFDLD
ncbi:DUF397 domain-containing protein [Actinomadura xylanilytica]|uniref:DUF397 domain-containing protein n=1 Tax=Actinomadura xylanilytica TaxID=887459 RepID=UPI00255B3EA4|nr:DUF397 domain-containing protein [Actinomadura xylanilytica]MDL4771788.1 DUF397 domain-containing protein [Actinomadura xylanilytica]